MEAIRKELRSYMTIVRDTQYPVSYMLMNIALKSGMLPLILMPEMESFSTEEDMDRIGYIKFEDLRDETKVERIKQVVAEYYCIIHDGSTRKREHTQYRQVCMHILKRTTEYSLAKIGAMFPNPDGTPRSHATVLHGVKTVNNLLETDKYMRIDMEKIELKLGI